ncbi:MAG: T9SS type A sorting domain-containing protein [Prevotella sp.]|nr:T9SS type A sorting domain-containing protein [Prevotella sp.]MCM1074863.1 T9SS type A sorting domain-containing protein [Ruminococcus sp.]
MNKLFKPLCLTATLSAMAFTASAQSVTEFPPVLTKPMAVAPAQGMQRAPLNTDRGLGVKIFAATNYDRDRAHHFTWFWSETPSKLNKMDPIYQVGNVEEEDFPAMFRVCAGAWLGDAYYAIRVKDYTFVTYVDGWLKVDPKTGKWEKVNDLIDNADNWPYIYDLAWNPQTDKAYGLANSDKAGSKAKSRLMNIDKAAGKWTTTEKYFDEYYFAGAFNYSGDFYAIRWTYDEDNAITGAQLDVFDENLEFQNGFPITVDGRAFKPYYQHGLEFDYTTGELWWAATDVEGAQKIVKIDPSTGQTVNKGTPGFAETLVALYVDYTTAESLSAPAQIKELNYNVNFDGANKVQLSWTNPSTRWNRFSLSNLSDVRIYRDDYSAQPVATLEAVGKEGQPMTWTDEAAPAGKHTYYVVACNEKGRGVPDHIDAFIGKDAPGMVGNLVASTTDGKSVHLAWTAPAKGDSDGWYDNNGMTYNITRMPDGKKVTGITELSYDDIDIPEAQSYTYHVSAVNAQGEGAAVVSNAVLAGKSVLIPYKADFSDQITADRFTGLDKNSDGITFKYDYNTNTGGYSMTLVNTSSPQYDDILVSPPLSVEKGKTYRVIYTMSAGGYGSSDRYMFHDFVFTGGKAATIAGQSDELGRIDDFETKSLYPRFTIDNYFTAEETGEYYVGLNICTQDESDMWYYVDGFEISEAPDNDLAAEKLETHLHVSTKSDNQFKVTLYNNGKNDQSNYEVQVAAIKPTGERVVVGSTTDVPVLKSHTSAVVTVPGHGGPQGTIDYVGIVKLEGDGKADNNETPVVTVEAEEMDPFNHTVSGNTENTSTRNPLCHYTAASASQTIYTSKMIGLKANEPLVITRIAWEYEGKDTFDGTKVKLYLENTDKEGFGDADEEKYMVPVTSEPYFDYEVSVAKGMNYMVIDLDEPFKYDTNKNLLLTLTKNETAHNGFLTVFRAFDEDWYLDKFHTLSFQGTSEFDVTNAQNKGTRFPEAPVIHLSVANLSAAGETGSTEMVIAEGGSVYFDSTTSSLVANGLDVTSVSAYSMDGRLVSTVANGAKAERIAMNLPSGIYVVSATLASGRTVSVKVQVL